MRVAFLMTEMNGLGGTVRSTLGLARGLVGRGDEAAIISVFDSPTSGDLDIPPGVEVRTLSPYAMSGAGAAPAGRSGPARVFPSKEELYKRFDAETESLVENAVRGADADVLVSTRTGLAAYLAAFAPAGTVTVGQIHENPGSHNPGLRAQLREVCAKLDAVEVLTEGARRAMEAYAPELAPRIHVLPNAVDDTLARPAPDGTGLVVAVGRYAPIKQFDLLVEAFAGLAPDFPEWRLRIFGRGPEGTALRRLAERAGLSDRITVPGPAIPAFAEWAKADIGVSSSRVESFGIAIVEAMRMGVPVVATDVPEGPRELITDGENGLLVEPSAASIERALRRLMGSRELRGALGRRAVETSERYDFRAVAERHADLFAALARGKVELAGTRSRKEAPRLVAERVDAETVDLAVHGAGATALVLRSKSTGERLLPEPLPADREGPARYRIERERLGTGPRMEDWEVLTEPDDHRLDHIGTVRMLEAVPRSPSDLLPQAVEGRLVLRSRRRRRYAEVQSFVRVERDVLRLEVEVLGERLKRGELHLLHKGGALHRAVRGKERKGRYRFEFDAAALAGDGAPLRLSVRLTGDGPDVTVGSLGADMGGRRFMGLFEVRGGEATWEWGYDKSGTMFLRCD